MARMCDEEIELINEAGLSKDINENVCVDSGDTGLVDNDTEVANELIVESESAPVTEEFENCSETVDTDNVNIADCEIGNESNDVPSGYEISHQKRKVKVPISFIYLL